MRFAKSPLNFTVGVLTISLFVLSAANVHAQGKQAVLILRTPNVKGQESGCEGATEIKYELVMDVKINGKDEVRLLNGLNSNGPDAVVSRKAYEDSGKIKLKELVLLKSSNDGVLRAVTGQTPIAAVPDNMKPQKSASLPLSAFYGVTVTAEARDGKQKRKLSFGLSEVSKIYFVPENPNVNDILFNHAADEQSVALWEAYLRKTNNYRGDEANGKMRDALVACARADLRRFKDGDYRSLEKALQQHQRAQSVKENDDTRQLVADIRSEQQEVEDARTRVEQLNKTGKWDEAIDAASTIVKYLNTWPDLKQLYDQALQESHNRHLNAADNAFNAGRYEASLEDCTTARKRLPNSEQAQTCICRARNEIALRDEKKARQINHPRDAKELLERQLAASDCSPDSRLVGELKVAKCEYAQQLYAEAWQLLGAPASGNVNLKLVTMPNKNDFREAREKLLRAGELCSYEGIRALLEATNRRLSDFCMTEAKSALQRNDNGTAYVYLQSARSYSPDDGAVAGLLTEARERFQQQTRVSIGTVFENNAPGETSGVVLGEVSEAIYSAAREANLAQYNILDGEAAVTALRSIQSDEPIKSPTVIFTGTLLAAGVNVSDNPHSVYSSYTFDNPRWREADKEHDDVNDQYKKCRKQNGDAACEELAARVEKLRAFRDKFERTLTERYEYRENPIHVTGEARMSLRINDSISPGVRNTDNLEAVDETNCVERSGVRPEDSSAKDNVCAPPDPAAFFRGIVAKVKSEAHRVAVIELSDLPLSYYQRAQGRTNRQQAVEDYLRFLFLTGNKSSSEAQRAKAFLLSYDPELTTDGALR